MQDEKYIQEKSICRAKRFSKVSILLSQAQPGAGPSSFGSSWLSLRSFFERTAPEIEISFSKLTGVETFAIF